MRVTRNEWVLAALSGVALGCAFPPVDCNVLIWVSLAPLIIVAREARSFRAAWGCGYLAGLMFFLLTLHPLVSAHSWAGWASETAAVFQARMTRQWWFMHAIWIGCALWCALFWALWAVLVRGLARNWSWGLLVAPSLWLMLPEALRSWATFGPAWAFLGNATADYATIRQWASIGGVWLLSALAVCVNWGVACTLTTAGRTRWQAASSVAALIVAAWCGGEALLARHVELGPSVRVAVIQHARVAARTSDFSTIGLDRDYFTLARQAIVEGAELIVLPESVAFGAISLDGTASQVKPAEWQRAREGWDRQLALLLDGRPGVLVAGLDTVEQGHDHNTLVAWSGPGARGWYHKRRLVPFAEYLPRGWGGWASRGRSQYVPGQGAQLIHAGDLVLGGFICQEVLFPSLTRESVRAGAELLVSGGNDGVFGDPAVAAMEADAAQLRAVETGRYVVRAMKTGVSAIIDPTGQETVRSRSSETAILSRTITPRRDQTPYVQWGGWVLWLACALVAGTFWSAGWGVKAESEG